MRDIVKQAILEMMARNGGTLHEVELVAAAKDARHPAHPEFEWNDKVAGHEYRLRQAATLIAAVRVEMPGIGLLRPRVVPATVRNPHGPGYLTISKAREDEDVARAAAVQYFGRAAQALRKARIVAELLGFADEVDATIAELIGWQRRVQDQPEA